MTDNIVGLNGQPLEPEVGYDAGLVDMLERVIDEVKHGHVTGVGIATTGPHTSGFEIVGHYQGARLQLLAAANRLVHKLNVDLDRQLAK